MTIRDLKIRGSRHGKNRTEPKTVALNEIPDPPGELDQTAAGKWRELCPILQRLGTLSAENIDHLRVYVLAFSRLLKAESMIQEQGEITEYPNGLRGVNHWCRVAAMAENTMYRSGQELGLNATARSKLATATQEKGVSRFFAKAVG